MQVVSQLDPIARERELLERIDAAHPRNEAGRTLVLVPTARLAGHVQRRLLEKRPAWLGLRVSSLSALAREILTLREDAVPRVVSDLLLEALLNRLVDAHPRNPWVQFVRERPGALRTLHETLKDLREAGVEPETVAGCRPESGLVEIFHSYHAALEHALEQGWTDRAGLVRRATADAAELASSYQAIFVHGAYDWTGVNLDLLRALDRGRELTVLVPVCPGRPVSRFAERFADAYLERVAVDGESKSTDTGILSLDALFDEESRPDPVPEDRLSFAHAQGPHAEVKLAVREALRAVENGCPSAEIVLTARSLAPYAAALEEVFEDEGLPWSSSLAVPLRRSPAVRELLLLLRVVAEGFPRAATVHLLGSSILDWSALPGGEVSAPAADRADRWSREAGLIGGIGDWSRDLPDWVRKPRTYPGQSDEAQEEARAQAVLDGPVADGVARCVSAIDDLVDTGRRSWSAHADRLRDLLPIFDGANPGPDGAGAREALAGLLDEMAQLETLVGETGAVTFERMRSWLEQAVDRSQLEIHPATGGGIRVLDAMQLRGLTFRHVHLLGMNAGLFPRAPREDPILDDEARRAIARRSGRPLGQKLEAADEERLLLAIVLGSARDSVQVSWQRADPSGKARTPSLALRELARLRYGSADFSRLSRDARHLRSHPAQELEDLLERPALLSRSDEMLLAVLRSRGSAQAEALGERFDRLVPGLTMLRATESWDFAGPEYDARVGADGSDPSFSVSALETLGTCPLQYFFDRILRVEELPDEPTAVAIPSREIGHAVHELLERLYARLAEEGLFDEERSVDLVERGLELLEESRRSLLGELGARAASRLPLLWRENERSWMNALTNVVRADLQRAERRKLKLLGVEEQRRERLDLGEGRKMRLSARFDRRLKGVDGVIVGDYKTSKKLKDRVNPTKMLKGLQLQVPLYHELAGSDSTVELLGIHPDLAEDDARAVFEGFSGDEQAESFRDTLRILLDLRSQGVYPFRAEFHCNWCPFTAACRRHHPPTADREARSNDGRAYRELKRKKEQRPYG